MTKHKNKLYQQHQSARGLKRSPNTGRNAELHRLRTNNHREYHMKRSYHALRHHSQHVHAELIGARLELKHSIIIDCLLSRNNLGGRQSTQDKNIIGSMNSLYGAERLRHERLLMIPPEKTKNILREIVAWIRDDPQPLRTAYQPSSAQWLSPGPNGHDTRRLGPGRGCVCAKVCASCGCVSLRARVKV